MYSQENLDSIREQFKQKLFLLLIAEGFMTAVLVYSLIVRTKWLTMLITCLMGAIAVFYGGMTLVPLNAYRRFLAALLPGRKRELTGMFRGFDAHPVLRDNVEYLSFLVNIGDPEQPKDDRQLYYDCNLPLPDWREGERFWFESFDKSVTNWRRE